MKRFFKNKYIIASFLCIIIYTLYLIMMKIYPFGKYSILKSDMYQQYINFFCYLREVILHGKSIAISWNLGLANNFYTTFAYYLMSPLNIFVIFFKPSNMDIFVELLTGIKLILMSNFMMLFLEKSYHYKNNEIIIFGLMYAFSSYVMCYSFHIMWLDCVYMLPIVLLFVDKFLENGKILPLVISLSYSILTNYYIGYIVAFFAGIYFLAKYFIISKKTTWTDFIKYLFKFLLPIAISFGIGMIVILPSILQLKGKMSADIELIKIDLDKIKLFINVIFNNYVYMFTQKSCLVFSSTLTILLLPMYYLNKKIKTREKLFFSAIIAFLLLPIVSPFFNKLWHAFTTPNCFNYRYSFTLIFVLILLGTREFQNKKYCRKWHFAVSLAIFATLNLIEIIFLKKGYLVSDNYSVTMQSIALSWFVYLLMTFIIYMYFFKKNLKHASFILLLVVVIFDLLIGARSGQNNNDKYFERKYVVQYDNFFKTFMQKIKNPEIERIVFEPDEYGSNMSLKYGYSNIGFFSSARNRETLKAMYKLGYNVQMDEQLWITSFSGTFLNYSIAGVKYYITRRHLEDNEIYGFEFDEKYDDFYVYKNKNAFNIGYYLADNIKDYDNPFEMQNELIRGLSSYNIDKLSEEKEKKNKDSMREKNNNKEENSASIGEIYEENSRGKGKIQKEYKRREENAKEEYFQSIEKSDVLECEKNLMVSEKNGEKVLKYKVKAKKDCNIYLSSDYELQVYINRKPQFKDYANIWSTENGIKQIKYLKQDEEFEFTIETKQNIDSIYVYVSDNEKIQKALDNKNSNAFSDVKINKNGLSGTANFKDNGYLVFGIAFDNCWKIIVDGKEAKKEAVAGCFLGVKLERGEHSIELKGF